MTVGEVRKICDGEPIQLIGSRTGKKLANSWNNVTEVLARYDNHESCGIFASMRVQTDRVNMPNYLLIMVILLMNLLLVIELHREFFQPILL